MMNMSLMTMNIILEACISSILFSLGKMHNTDPYLGGLQAKANALQEIQPQTQEELDALLPPSRPSP